MKRVLVFVFCLIAFGLVAQVIYQPHRRNAFRSKAAFQPSDVPGLVIWFDASTISSPTNVNGYLVTNWWDRSSSAYMAYSAGNGEQPYYTNNASRIGGKPWLQFDGVDDRLKAATTQLYTQPNTVFIVECYNYVTAGGSGFLFAGTNIAGACAFYVNSFKVPLLYAGTVFTGNNYALSNQWYLFEGTFTNGGSEIITNGVLNKSGNSGTGGLTGIHIGISYATNGPLNGGIAEILFYNTNVEATVDRVKIRSYFTNKYGPFPNW